MYSFYDKANQSSIVVFAEVSNTTLDESKGFTPRERASRGYASCETNYKRWYQAGHRPLGNVCTTTLAQHGTSMSLARLCALPRTSYQHRTVCTSYCCEQNCAAVPTPSTPHQMSRETRNAGSHEISTSTSRSMTRQKKVGAYPINITRHYL